MRDVFVVRKSSRRLSQDDGDAFYVEIEGYDQRLVLLEGEVASIDEAHSITERVADIIVDMQNMVEQQQQDFDQVNEECTTLHGQLAQANDVNADLHKDLQNAVWQLTQYKADAEINRRQTKQLAVVPNDEEGKKFIKFFRDHIQPGKKVVLRGRKPKDGYGKRVSIPLKDAQAIGITVENK